MEGIFSLVEKRNLGTLIRVGSLAIHATSRLEIPRLVGDIGR